MSEIILLEQMLESKVFGDMENPIRKIKKDFIGKEITVEIKILQINLDLVVNGKIHYLSYPEVILVKELSEGAFKSFLSSGLSSKRYFRNNLCQSKFGLDYYENYLCCGGNLAQDVVGISFVSEKHKIKKIVIEDFLIYQN